MRKFYRILIFSLTAGLLMTGCSRARETAPVDVPGPTESAGPTTLPETESVGPTVLPETGTPSAPLSPEVSPSGTPSGPESPSPAPDPTEAPEKNGMYDLLREVFEYYHAGVAGSTLTAAYYAASVVDWAQTNGLDAARRGALAWDLGTETEFGELFSDKLAALRDIAGNMTPGLLNDCGYTGDWNYTREEIEAVFDCLDAALNLEGGGPATGTVLPAGAAGAETPTAEGLLAGLTLREKVGQLFIVRPDALDPAQPLAQIGDANAPAVLGVDDSIRDQLARYPVGGVAVYGKNIQSPDQLRALVDGFQEASAVPMFVCVDEEGGAVARLANNAAFALPKYGDAASVGSAGDPAQAEAMGGAIGGYLKDFGFSVDFAPVADVNTNPDNPIGRRAFSSDPAAVASMAGAMARGLAGQGIIPVYKHFPGHGGTSEDSHEGLAVSYRTLEEMKACEWVPYSGNDLTGCGVMVGHIAAPSVTGGMEPASLSRTMVTSYLRDALGFRGLVFTDALSMDGITKNYDDGTAAVAALQAGCDVLLMPYDLAAAYDAVLSAAENGQITPQRLDESVLRILEYKLQAGVIK